MSNEKESSSCVSADHSSCNTASVTQVRRLQASWGFIDYSQHLKIHPETNILVFCALIKVYHLLNGLLYFEPTPVSKLTWSVAPLQESILKKQRYKPLQSDPHPKQMVASTRRLQTWVTNGQCTHSIGGSIYHLHHSIWLFPTGNITLVLSGLSLSQLSFEPQPLPNTQTVIPHLWWSQVRRYYWAEVSSA